MPAAHLTLLQQQSCYMHNFSNLRPITLTYARHMGPAQQSTLPRHSWLSSAASSTTWPCQLPCNRVQTRTARSSTSQNSSSMPHDNPLALAFLGDAIWSLCVRRHFLSPPKHHSLYQSSVRQYVTAEGQAAMYDQLLSSSSSSSSSSNDSSSQLQLTPAEAALLRRVASWEAVKLRKRFASPAAAEVYRKATALEALVGHLHLNDLQRLEQLVQALLPPPPLAGAPGSSIPASPQQTLDAGIS